MRGFVIARGPCPSTGRSLPEPAAPPSLVIDGTNTTDHHLVASGWLRSSICLSPPPCTEIVSPHRDLLSLSPWRYYPALPIPLDLILPEERTGWGIQSQSRFIYKDWCCYHCGLP